MAKPFFQVPCILKASSYAEEILKKAVANWGDKAYGIGDWGDSNAACVKVFRRPKTGSPTFTRVSSAEWFVKLAKSQAEAHVLHTPRLQKRTWPLRKTHV